MFELFERVIERLKYVWGGMTLNQRVVSGAILVAIVGVSLFLTTLSTNLTDFTVLVADLDPQDAAPILEQLEQQNVPYNIIRNGTAIEVPVDMADRLRIDMASQGLPESGLLGYEILDSSNFGMSDFLQKANYKRALTGELRKTLRTLDEIDNASVLLNIPEPTLFTDEAEKATASVTIKLRSNRTLPARTVQALTNLVGSATGIDPNDVTIVDTKGRLLTRPDMDETAMLSSTQFEMKTKTDKYIADKVKLLLNGAFPGLALVEVNAELNFDHIERQITTYDPDATAILSEEREEVTNPTAEGGGEEYIVTNYETSFTVENFIQNPGSISRLSVSVMLDERTDISEDENGERIETRIPWTQQELQSISQIAESAVSFDQSRGDTINIMPIAFDSREDEDFVAGGITIQAALLSGFQAVSTALAIIIGIIVFFVILRNISNSLDPSKMTLQSDSILDRERSEIISEEETESEKTVLLRKIITKAANDPENTAKTIRTIYREEEG